ncbi:single-stranded DNA-binding protein [Anaerolinea thermophila]|uniref:Single-stranded DNA-binding protein n=1 Tax=Anaerolinea thermophila (strain DSM 14523 / JCM 11388 / NBRC 100420 / UNI-1) TaxID=926569 RepID=E8N1Q1_ANATU|nr:single-stranded DNA-binding protein [Anaerolinea thermophila]BAJ62656.1 single-stranded DNA-binding protein [Anaerolinea thermophila UNI-1]
MTFHTIIIVGNVGREPEMRYTPAGQPVTSFSVASNRSYTNQQGEKVDETIWFRVSAFGKLAETCNQFLHKGSRVLVEGRLVPDKNGSPRIWTRQDGTAGASYEVTATTVRFLSARGEGGAEAGGDLTIPDVGDMGEDIPF